jgi:hypothetical protein
MPELPTVLVTWGSREGNWRAWLVDGGRGQLVAAYEGSGADEYGDMVSINHEEWAVAAPDLPSILPLIAGGWMPKFPPPPPPPGVPVSLQQAVENEGQAMAEVNKQVQANLQKAYGE